MTLYTYDPVGDLLTRSNAVGTLEYGYDAADRLKEVVDSKMTLRAFGYDNADRLTATTIPQRKARSIRERNSGVEEGDMGTRPR